jgi:hypothetical protein
LQEQLKGLRNWFASPAAYRYRGVEPIDQIMKPIPTLNLHGTPPGYNYNSALAKVLARTPGEVALVDVQTEDADQFRLDNAQFS